MTELSFRQCLIRTRGKFYKVQLRKIIRDSTASTDEVIIVYLSVRLYMLRRLDISIRGRRKISRRRLAEVYYSLVNFIIKGILKYPEDIIYFREKLCDE